ncbi:MAG: DNA repair protein RecN [Spirochaetales bacterium]|jgi:DNA repair protein RecN (Recombination protein N)|nr:DNA repair protein RecN [Spirochaetales bacterium]
MLCELHIKNLAIIEDLSLVFTAGFSILTGETGAGKSIILHSLGRLSGGKGSGNVVRSGTEQAVIEAIFEVPQGSPVPDILDASGIDSEDELIIKRIISVTGRSRFYINGSLANGKSARQIANHLLSIASQHDHQQLLQRSNHLQFIDTMGDHLADRLDYQNKYNRWRTLQEEFNTLSAQNRDKEQRKEFLQYQVKEIDDCALVIDEDLQLDEEKSRLRSSTGNQQLAAKSLELLFSANQNLIKVRSNLEQIANVDHEALALSENIAEQSYLLEDHFSELRHYADNIPHDPARLEEITERIGNIAALKRKYGTTIEEILAYADSSKQELTTIENIDETLEKLHENMTTLHDELRGMAKILSTKRKITGKQLITEMNTELTSLCLKNGLFDIQIQTAELNHLGCNDVEFLFCANLGEQVKPLKEVASGGELSRLLLGLKCILAQKDYVETIIFDEIDSGISGEAAESVALKIKQLSKHHQVICISHLVQIASLADDHFRVKKEISGNRTTTAITLLNQDQTLESLAHMLDGTSVSDSTRKYVQKLMARNNQ